MMFLPSYSKNNVFQYVNITLQYKSNQYLIYYRFIIFSNVFFIFLFGRNPAVTTWRYILVKFCFCVITYKSHAQDRETKLGRPCTRGMINRMFVRIDLRSNQIIVQFIYELIYLMTIETHVIFFMEYICLESNSISENIDFVV